MMYLRSHVQSGMLVASCVGQTVIIIITYFVFWALASPLACYATYILCFVSIFSLPCFVLPSFLFMTVSSSLLIFSLPLHSFFYSFSKSFKSTFTFFYFFLFPLVFLFNFSYILQEDVFIYFVIYIIHLYFVHKSKFFVLVVD